jgi:hypothetical protein
MKKKILLICYGGGHSSIIKIIIDKLILNSDFDYVIIPLNGAIDNFKNTLYNDKVMTLSSFNILFDKDIDEILKYGRMLLKENYNPKIGISKIESIFYLGLSFFDLVKEYGYCKAIEIYDQKKRQAFMPMGTMIKILEHIKPDLIITTTSPRFEYATIKSAKFLGIKSLQILDLFGDDYPIPTADYIITMNQAVADKLKLNGNISSCFYPIGQPVLEDTVYKVQNVNALLIKSNFELLSKKILLFSPTRNFIFNDDFSLREELDVRLINDIIFNILDKVAIQLNIQILIRPHPSDNIINYNEYINGKDFYSYIPSLDLYQSIAISDFSLSYFSTISLQTLVCKKPSFTFNQNPNLPYPWLEFTSQPFIFSSNYMELEANLLQNISNNIQVDLDNFFEMGSIDRINSLLIKLIN